MRAFTRLLVASALLLGFNGPAFASGVFLAGDNNIFTTQQDNEILFQNVFNGQNVLTDSATGLSLGGLGTTANVTTALISSANLAGQDFLLTGFRRTSYSASERADIVDFVNGGGSLFLVGEYNFNFTDVNTALNEVLSDVGSTLSLSLTQNLIGASDVVLDSVTNSTVFGAGVNGWFTEGAQALLLLGLNGQAVVSGRDPRPCPPSSIPTCDGVGQIGTVIAYDALSAIPVPAAVWLFGTALVGVAGFTRRGRTPRT